MPAPAAGILLYRRRDERLEVLLSRPAGGRRGWSVPSRQLDADRGTGMKPRLHAKGHMEALLALALHALEEDAGRIALGPFLPLGGVKQHGHRLIFVWACEEEEGDTRPLPPGVAYLEVTEARARITPQQRRFLDDVQVLAGG